MGKQQHGMPDILVDIHVICLGQIFLILNKNRRKMIKWGYILIKDLTIKLVPIPLT